MMSRSTTTSVSGNSVERSITKCYICSKVYSSPRMLPCAHTYCLPCLERLGVNKRPGDDVVCPLCRHEFRLSTQGFVGLPRNIFIEELAEVEKMADQAMRETQCDVCFEVATCSGRGENEIRPATVHCFDCLKNMCSSCIRQGSLHNFDETLENGDTSRHDVVDLNVYLQRLYKRDITYCDLHPDEPIGLYCFDCRTVLCTMCNIDGAHRIHRCQVVERAAKEFNHRLDNDVMNIVGRTTECVKLVETVQVERQDFVNSVESMEDEIKKKGEKLKALVDCHVDVLLSELSEVRHNALKKLDSVHEELERFLVTTESFVRYTEAIREHGSPLDISRSGHDLVTRAITLQRMPFVPSGADYRTPLVAFRPWYDLLSLLNNDKDNVVGSLVTVPKNKEGNSPTDYCLNPMPVRTLHQDAKAILGVAAMSGHVFVVRVETPEVELYSAVTWSLQRYLAVPGLQSPTDLAACQSLNRLYVCDWSNSCVHFVDVTDDRPVQRHHVDNGSDVNGLNGEHNDEAPLSNWMVDDKPWSLSVSQKCNSLIVVCDQVRKLCEYTLHGSLIRRVSLASDLVNPRHAVLLASGRFVVSFPSFICIVGADGKRITSKFSNQSAVFGLNRINVSGRLSLDDKGHVIVLDVNGKRILQLSSDSLEFIREIVPFDERLRYAARLCIDSTRGRIYVADNEVSSVSGLLKKSKFWGKTGSMVVYETQAPSQ